MPHSVSQNLNVNITYIFQNFIESQVASFLKDEFFSHESAHFHRILKIGQLFSHNTRFKGGRICPYPVDKLIRNKNWDNSLFPLIIRISSHGFVNLI